MKGRKHISDGGSTPPTSTRALALLAIINPVATYSKSFKALGGGVLVSTGCDERSGGNRQTTTEPNSPERALRLNSVNNKRQSRQRVRAASRGLISPERRGCWLSWQQKPAKFHQNPEFSPLSAVNPKIPSSAPRRHPVFSVYRGLGSLFRGMVEVLYYPRPEHDPRASYGLKS